jgi:hypothetical protein
MNKEIEQVKNLIKITRIKKEESLIDFRVEPECSILKSYPFFYYHWLRI